MSIEQQRKLVTAIPGPRSVELHKRKLAAVAAWDRNHPAGVRRTRHAAASSSMPTATS